MALAVVCGTVLERNWPMMTVENHDGTVTAEIDPSKLDWFLLSLSVGQTITVTQDGTRFLIQRTDIGSHNA